MGGMRRGTGCRVHCSCRAGCCTGWLAGMGLFSSILTRRTDRRVTILLVEKAKRCRLLCTLALTVSLKKVGLITCDDIVLLDCVIYRYLLDVAQDLVLNM